MIKIYGSMKCPDCRKCKYNFDLYGIEYKFIDIMESMPNLKEFLHMRDTLPIFANYRGSTKVGIPYLVDSNGTDFHNWENYLTEKGFEVKDISTKGASCSINGKGC